MARRWSLTSPTRDMWLTRAAQFTPNVPDTWGFCHSHKGSRKCSDIRMGCKHLNHNGTLVVT